LAYVLPVSPVGVSAELAEAALASPPLVAARKMAEWVGEGRQLTDRGVPRVSEAADACRALGIVPPTHRVRSSMDIEGLQRGWAMALGTGLVVTDGHRAWSVPDAIADDPASVLASWVRLVAHQFAIPDDPWPHGLAVLHELHTADRPLSMADLVHAAAAVDEEEEDEDDDQPWGPPNPFDGVSAQEHAEAAVAALLFFEAVNVDDEAVRLTPLGSLLARSVSESCAPPSEADAGAFVSAICMLPDKLAMDMARSWLQARSVADAVRELLGFAEAADAEERTWALWLARDLGPEGVAGWQGWADRPGFGAYAREWLAEAGEPVEEHPSDEAWLAVDDLSMMMDWLLELSPLRLSQAIVQELGGDMELAHEVLRSSRHPAATDLERRLAAGPEPGVKARKSAKKRSGEVYRLKITLDGVANPLVWRRVLVPADITLDKFSEVILRSMGWLGSHLHVFEDEFCQYGPTGDDLEFSDESEVQLAEVLAEPGERLSYIYDFGNSWAHDIVLEEILPAAPGTEAPSCLAGKGACPPEDCGGSWGYEELKEALASPGHRDHQYLLNWLGQYYDTPFDPWAFSTDLANSRLGRSTESS
jgi:hypothetical protein